MEISALSNQAYNLLELARENNLPVAITELDIDELMSEADENDLWKANHLKRIIAHLHAVCYTLSPGEKRVLSTVRSTRIVGDVP